MVYWARADVDRKPAGLAHRISPGWRKRGAALHVSVLNREPMVMKARSKPDNVTGICGGDLMSDHETPLTNDTPMTDADAARDRAVQAAISAFADLATWLHEHVPPALEALREAMQAIVDVMAKTAAHIAEWWRSIPLRVRWRLLRTVYPVPIRRPRPALMAVAWSMRR